MRTLAVIVLGAGVLGAGCHETYDSVADDARSFAGRNLEYVGEVRESSNKELNEACSNRFPSFETRAFNVTGLNWEERVVSIDICCIVERHNYDRFLDGHTSIRGAYCRKMQQLPEAEQ